MALSTRLIFRAPLIRNFLAPCVSSYSAQKSSGAHIASVTRLQPSRFFTTSGIARNSEESEENAKRGDEPIHEKGSCGGKKRKYYYHPVEVSLRYLKSNAYKRTYGNEPVWTHYRRNFKGQFPPDTREACVRENHIRTGSPCPICRDEYLVVHYKNPELLEQFISPTTGQILKTMKTGVCQKVQFQLELEIMKAHDFGTLQYEPPFRRYVYEHYYKFLEGHPEFEGREDHEKSKICP